MSNSLNIVLDEAPRSTKPAVAYLVIGEEQQPEPIFEIFSVGDIVFSKMYFGRFIVGLSDEIVSIAKNVEEALLLSRSYCYSYNLLPDAVDTSTISNKEEVSPMVMSVLETLVDTQNQLNSSGTLFKVLVNELNSPYSVPSNTLVFVNSSLDDIVLNLPQALDNTKVIIKKISGISNNVIINAAEGFQVEGKTSQVISIGFGHLELYAFEGNWYIISKSF